MRENRLINIWNTGKTAVNGWLTVPTSSSAEIPAHAGFDSLTIDLQLGLVDYETALTMLQAVSTTEAVPMARVPWNDPGIIMRLLDAGAYGIICPMIDRGADAEAFVGACRYPVEGGGGSNGDGNPHPGKPYALNTRGFLNIVSTFRTDLRGQDSGIST